MANVILTPVTLWKDFDGTLPLNEEIISEREESEFIHREIYFYGRQTAKERVKIFARYIFPKGAGEYPAVMVLFEAGLPADMKLVERLTGRGYAVFCVDYCGDDGTDRHTVYPEDVDYANFSRAGRHIAYAEPTAKETSWYEWAAVARYGARYLAEKKEVTKFGAIGIRTGGEVLWKVAPYAGFSCMVSVCASGWLAYRGLEKFGEGEKHAFDEERHRFIAGIDSQSYAPYVKCPVLMLSAINDKKYSYDRVYDTFQQINPASEKAILFSSHGNGLIGSHSLFNLNLFLDKYLKGRSAFISKPISVSAGEDEEGNLVVKGEFDVDGEIDECGIFYTEKITGATSRDWTRVLGQPEDVQGNVGIFPLSLYKKSDKVLVYSFVRYSNGFSVTSKIMEITLKRAYKNACPKSRIIYSSSDGLNGFCAHRRRARSIADCFAEGSDADVRLEDGYGGIKGITSSSGLISYRVGEERYGAPENAVFQLDAYAKEDAALSIIFYTDADEQSGYSYKTTVAGGGKWKKLSLEAGDFKAETGAQLADFSGVFSVVLQMEGEVLFNNVIWL